MALKLVGELLDIFQRDHTTRKRPLHLRPFYYRVLLTTRPFGLALCKTFDEKYLCVVLPESPSGQLGLRAGSEILSINSFAQKSEVIKLLNDKYPSQKQHNFIWMYQFPKVQYLQDNSVMPITLYLKYDPFVVLSQNTEKVLTDDEKKQQESQEKADKDGKKEESCNYWKLLQDDIYRWAVEQMCELWQVAETCDVYTMPAIQSPIIENNILHYYHSKTNKKIIQNKLNNKDDMTQIKTMNQFIVEDEYYKKIGEIEAGTKVKVYAKAGAYLEIREPINGWIKFKIEGEEETKDYCVKCAEQDIERKENESIKELTLIDRNKGDFTLFITRNYLVNLVGIKPIKTDSDNAELEDREYNIIDVINAANLNGDGGGNRKMCILYFMGDIDFGHTFDTQQTHLKQLINLHLKYNNQATFIVIRVCCVNNDIKSEKVAEKLKIGNKELNGFIYGRARMEILKIYGLLTYDTGFFKYGLMLLNEENKIIIHPKENMNLNKQAQKEQNDNDLQLGIFERVASCILRNQCSYNQ